MAIHESVRAVMGELTQEKTQSKRQSRYRPRLHDSVSTIIESMGVSKEWWEDLCTEAELVMERDNPNPNQQDPLVAKYGKRAPYILAELKQSGIPNPESVIPHIYDIALITKKMQKKKQSPYLPVITKWVANKSLRIPSDVQKVKTNLTEFNRQVQAGTLKGAEADINRFATEGDLFRAINKNQGKGKTLGFESQGGKHLPQYDTTVGNREYRVYQIDTHEAMKKCGSNSNWCVVHKQYFDQYMPPYYLFTVFEGGDEKRVALGHVRSRQLKGEDDEPLRKSDPDAFDDIEGIMEDIASNQPEPEIAGDHHWEHAARAADKIRDIAKLSEKWGEYYDDDYTNLPNQDDFDDDDEYDKAMDEYYESQQYHWEYNYKDDHKKIFGVDGPVFDGATEWEQIAKEKLGVDWKTLQRWESAAYDRGNAGYPPTDAPTSADEIRKVEKREIEKVFNNMRDWAERVERMNRDVYTILAGSYDDLFNDREEEVHNDF